MSRFKSVTNQVDNETAELMQKAKLGVADVFEELDLDIDMALSVLVTLYVITAKHAMELSKEDALESITTAIEMSYAMDELENQEWLN